MQMEQLCMYEIYLCINVENTFHSLSSTYIFGDNSKRVQSSKISRFLVLENAHLINLSQHWAKGAAYDTVSGGRKKTS